MIRHGKMTERRINKERPLRPHFRFPPQETFVYIAALAITRNPIPSPNTTYLFLSIIYSYMSSKYYSTCIQKRLLSSFLKDTLATSNSRVFATYITCRGARKKSVNKKRTALQTLSLNIQLTGTITDA